MTAHAPRKAGAFAKLVRQPGGVSLEEAVAAADANLETLRDGLAAEIESMIGKMQALERSLRNGPDAAALDELYKAANMVIGIAAMPGLRAIGQVCYSLCDLIDRLQTSQTWNAPAVRVHLDCLGALRPGTAENEAQQNEAVAALRWVVERV